MLGAIAIAILIGTLVVTCGVRIAHKTGISPFVAALLIVPGVNIAVVWIFALTPWPRLDGPQRGAGGGPPGYT